VLNGADAAAAIDRLARNPTPENILTCANKYGWISGVTAPLEWEQSDEGPQRVDYHAESIARIRFRLAELSVATELLTALCAGNPLTEFFQPEEGGLFRLVMRAPVPLDFPGSLASGFSVDSSMVLRPSNDGRQLVSRACHSKSMCTDRAGWMILTELIEHRLNQYSRLIWVDDEDGANYYLRRLVFEYPIGAAWDALAYSLESGAPPRRCPRCGVAFMQHRASKRRNAVSCSAKCQKHMARQRHDALELRTQGLGPTRISKRIGIDEKIVRGWIKAATNNARK